MFVLCIIKFVLNYERVVSVREHLETFDKQSTLFEVQFLKNVIKFLLYKVHI